MFCETIRENLDPFRLADDVTLWAALEAARLSTYVSGLEGKLEDVASPSGRECSSCLHNHQYGFLSRLETDFPFTHIFRYGT